MRLTGKKILTKLKQKNLGNMKLRKAVDQLISDLEKPQVDLISKQVIV